MGIIKGSVSKRHFGLDFIRALAILSVVFGHSRSILSEAFPGVSAIPLLRGVDVFFVLSGFLIGTRFLNRSKEGLSRSFGLSFLRHAALRILPLYFLFLLINIVTDFFLKDQMVSGYRILSCFVFMQNVFTPHIGFFWESWSLTITVWFYIALTVIMVSNYRLSKNLNVFKRQLLVLILGFIMWPIVVRFYIHFQGGLDYFWWDVKIRKFMPARFDSPFYGLLMAWLRFYYPKAFKKLAIPGLLAAVSIYLWYYLYTPAPGTFDKDILYLITSPLSYALALPILMRIKKAPQFIAYPFTYISIISYAMYLVNLWFFIVMRKTMVLSQVHPILQWLFYWIMVIALSWIVYKYIELSIREQFDKWKRSGVRFFPKKKDASGEAS
ncbi:MAG: acyltransferase [Salinivirgaceae bacterium]|jgi:peptidoglycan/LPS O-acetylase OafA/YrhL|nr:acyltransferase [Salinivirgaceae bacterium]